MRSEALCGRERRAAMRWLTGLAAGGIGMGTGIRHATAATLEADMAAGFAASTFEEALRALGGVAAHSLEITLEAPETAENGSAVAVSVTSRLPGTEAITIVVDSNPVPTAAAFTIPAGTEPFIATRIKMAQSGHVYAIVRAEGRLYGTSCFTRVVVGGCGG